MAKRVRRKAEEKILQWSQDDLKVQVVLRSCAFLARALAGWVSSFHAELGQYGVSEAMHDLLATEEMLEACADAIDEADVELWVRMPKGMQHVDSVEWAKDRIKTEGRPDELGDLPF